MALLTITDKAAKQMKRLLAKRGIVPPRVGIAAARTFSGGPGMGSAPLSSDLYEPGLAERVLTHMVTAVKRAESFDEPYSHVFFEDIFPLDVYERVLAGLPDPSLYLPLNLKQWSRADGTSTIDLFESVE